MTNEEIKNKYMKKKDFYTGENFFNDVGFNASWALDLPMGELQYKGSDWYIPGQNEIYRDEDWWELTSMNYIDLYKRHGMDYSEQNLDKYLNGLKKILFRDIIDIVKKTSGSCFSETKKNELNEITVLIYESQDVWKRIAGYKYNYFFIREEKNYCYSMVLNRRIYEGTLDELKSIVSSLRTVVAEFTFYLKWGWE